MADNNAVKDGYINGQTVKPQDDLINMALGIASKTQQIVQTLRQRGLPEPSLGADGPTPDFVPTDDVNMQALRSELVVQSRLLADIFTGPRKYLMEHGVYPNHISMTNRVIYTYQIPQHVPLKGSISFPDLSKACGLALDKLIRVARYAIMFHIFTEPQPGYLAHSAISKLLATEQMSMDFLGHNTEDVYPACMYQVEALREYGETTEPEDCGFSKAFGEGNKPKFFEYFAAHPERLKRFGGAMEFVGAPSGYISVETLFVGYDWLAKGAAKVVDVGGSMGHTSADLGKHAPQLAITVQDLPEVIEEAKVKRKTSPLPDNVALMAASFFDPQPITDADVYLFRLIFHDWPREKSLLILQNLIPSMKPGAELVINDFILYPSGDGDGYTSKYARAADMQMMVALNARERSVDDWVELVKDASPGALELVHAKGLVVAFRKVS